LRYFKKATIRLVKLNRAEGKSKVKAEGKSKVKTEGKVEVEDNVWWLLTACFSLGALGERYF
jgi:hypothetical protein